MVTSPRATTKIPTVTATPLREGWRELGSGEEKAVIQLKRAYEERAPADGERILVERLWPRGLTKEKAHIDLWLKDVAPSAELRKWYGHKVDKWDEFRRRYKAELAANKELVAELRRKAKQGPITLIYAARDTEHNSALVLKSVLEGKRSG
jgi:uncharacterized protein YeaO (DUF488 family)